MNDKFPTVQHLALNIIFSSQVQPLNSLWFWIEKKQNFRFICNNWLNALEMFNVKNYFFFLEILKFKIYLEQKLNLSIWSRSWLVLGLFVNFWIHPIFLKKRLVMFSMPNRPGIMSQAIITQKLWHLTEKFKNFFFHFDSNDPRVVCWNNFWKNFYFYFNFLCTIVLFVKPTRTSKRKLASNIVSLYTDLFLVILFFCYSPTTHVRT